MPHQCIRCGKLYDDGGKEILSGCGCGGKLFFFVKKEKLQEMKDVQLNLSKTEKKEIEKDVYDLVGLPDSDDKPVVLDFESIRVLKPGKYELDIVNLFRNRPLVYKLEEGKYIIDLPESFKKARH
ncbi:MAG: Zn-ribbon containing protein [archaeon]